MHQYGIKQHPARYPFAGRAKCTMVNGRVNGSKPLRELPKWQEGMETPSIGVFLGEREDTCAKMPFMNQNKPCNLPD